MLPIPYPFQHFGNQGKLVIFHPGNSLRWTCVSGTTSVTEYLGIDVDHLTFTGAELFAL